MTTGKVYDLLIVAESWGQARQWATAHDLDTNQWIYVSASEGLPKAGHFTSAWWDDVVVTPQAQAKHGDKLPEILNRAKYYQTDNRKPANGSFAFLYGEKNR